MSYNIIIEKAEKQDYPKILELYRQLNPTLFQNKTFTKIETKDLFNGTINNDIIKIYVLKLNKEIICTCTASIIPNPAQLGKPNLLIESFVTDEQHRNNGYGKKMLKFLIELAQEHECIKIMLMTKPENERAKAFYEKAGFDNNSKNSYILIL